MGIIRYWEKELNLSRIWQEYTRHTKLWGEIGESVTYIPGIYRA
jgi:hypothetical protein